MTRALAEEPGGPVLLAADGETVVDPAASFHLELAARAADARLVLLDARDAHVPGSGTREVGAATRLVFAPAAPLVPGSRYLLRLEGASARELHDRDRAFAPVAFSVLAAGTPPPSEPKKKPKRRRR